MMKSVLTTALVSANLVAASAPAGAQEMRAALTSASAKTIVAGCEAFAKENNLKVNIAVLDQGKNLIAFLRMDGAPLGSIDIAMWKANSSAAFASPTKARAESAKTSPQIGFAPNIAIFEGGEPIFTNEGTHIGGVGVSGAASADDAACGRAGIAKAGLKAATPN